MWRFVLFVWLYFSCRCPLFNAHITDILPSFSTNGLLHLGARLTKAGVVLHLNVPDWPTAMLKWRIYFPFAVIFCNFSFSPRNDSFCLKHYNIILLSYESVPIFHSFQIHVVKTCVVNVNIKFLIWHCDLQS